MQFYRERLWPSAWVFVSTALVMPASLLVFLPINAFVGVVSAIVLYGATVALLLGTSPIILVTSGEVVAGRARLPLEFAGDAQSYVEPEATLQRGRRLDARAWLVIRGWIAPVVKLPVEDANDPTPYWLFSTRHPLEVVQAIEDAKKSAVTPST